MGIDFTVDEVFEVAEQIERNGAQFYRNAAEKIDDAMAKDLLIQLAEMEDDHEKTFQLMKTQLSPNDKQITTFDPNGESENYLRALADTRVFYEKDLDTTSLKEILKAGITAEKDSIVFYVGMKDVVPGHLGKDKLDGIIKEEMSHINLLSGKLLSL